MKTTKLLADNSLNIVVGGALGLGCFSLDLGWLFGGGLGCRPAPICRPRPCNPCHPCNPCGCRSRA